MNKRGLLLHALAAAAMITDPNIFSIRNKSLNNNINFNGNISKEGTRDKKIFAINGIKIEAYSRKDAISRYKHLKN